MPSYTHKMAIVSWPQIVTSFYPTYTRIAFAWQIMGKDVVIRRTGSTLCPKKTSAFLFFE